MRRIALFALIATACALLARPAAAEIWAHRYVAADAPGEVSHCQAGTRTPDAAFLTRIYADDMDIFFRRDGLGVPSNERMGGVALEFDGRLGRRYVTLTAWSGDAADRTPGTARHLFLAPERADYGFLIEMLSASERVTVRFPDGSATRFGLRGSRDALKASERCWLRHQTGPWEGYNPFGESLSSRGGANPFR